MEINELGTPVKHLLWLSMRGGLEALGEYFSEEKHADGSGDSDSKKAIMPLKLMLSMMILVLILCIACLGLAAIWLGFGPWHYAPICVFSICVFWMTSWYQSHIVWLATTFLPIHEFGRHLANTGVAVLLCPLQLIATFAALRHAYPADTEHPSIEKKSEDDASTDRGSSPPRSTRTRLLYLLKDLVAFYSLLAPTNLPWAVTAESSKAGARMLSRYLSITEYAASGNSQVLYRLLNADTILIARRAACVLALFVFLWMALVLPATIGMRRMHAPLVILVLPDTLQSVPIDDCIWTKNWRQGKLTVSFSRAWHSLAWQQYRRLLAIYAASFFVLTFVAVAGISHFTVALGNPAWRPY